MGFIGTQNPNKKKEEKWRDHPETTTKQNQNRGATPQSPATKLH